MAGWTDPKTKRSTAFYALLGVLCANIYHTGLDHYKLAALCLMAGLGSVSAILDLLRQKGTPPGDGAA